MSYKEDFPMLTRLEKALEMEYLKMSDKEITQLHHEIEQVTSGETKCSDRKLTIANEMQVQVSDYYRYHIDGKR